MKIAETIIFLLNFFSHLFTILINPGIPSRKYYSMFSDENSKRDYNLNECKKCNIIVPKELNVSHCYNCNVCILKYDHHSDWMGKCIGKNNMITFYISMFSLSIYFVMSILSFMLYIIFIHEEKMKLQKMNSI